MNRIIRNAPRPIAAALSAIALLSCLALPASAYDDFEEITSHVSTRVEERLSVTRPAGDAAATSAASFYLTGGSNPDEPLTINGAAVENRGIFGSWGVWTALESGENVFTIENGSDSRTVAVTRGSGGAAVTDALTQPSPAVDIALRSGDEVLLSCVAPSGASVAASVGGKKIRLSQKAAASDGVPARFEGVYTIPAVSGTKELGGVTYSLSYGGGVSTYSSEGSFYGVGKGDTLLVEMKDASSTLFSEDSRSSSFVASAKKGAVDYVAEIGDSMYRLGSGGWVLFEAAQPLTENAGYKNKVSAVRFSADGRGETFSFEGAGKPVFRAYQNGERLHVTFAHTSGVKSVPTGKSRLFSSAEVSAADGGTAVDLFLSGEERLWGYVVEYGDGVTTLYCKYAPSRASGSQPLRGITVALDPGHGGSDVGAPGIANTSGPMEKDINYDTAVAVQKRLEKLGAAVVMTREGDTFESLSDRMWTSQQARADFFIALHSNAIAGDGTKPHGVEVYYYEDIAEGFAQTMLRNVSAVTGRLARRAAYSNYKVTLCTYAPAVLVEMGFVTNPEEYDSLCSRQGMYKVANAVADSILASLG